MMRRPRETLDGLPRERLAELVTAGCYGTVLVLAALGVVGVSDVALGHGSELVAGVGLATWLAHIFAELVGGHVQRPETLRRTDVVRSLVDGSPILVASVLPAIHCTHPRSSSGSGRTAATMRRAIRLQYPFRKRWSGRWSRMYSAMSSRP